MLRGKNMNQAWTAGERSDATDDAARCLFSSRSSPFRTLSTVAIRGLCETFVPCMNLESHEYVTPSCGATRSREIPSASIRALMSASSREESIPR